MLTCLLGHYEIWEQWKKNPPKDRSGLASLIATDEYEEWPRGRIVYNAVSHRFILYGDAQILRRPHLLTIIHERFGLPADRTNRAETRSDSHYRSTRRLAATVVPRP
jgi:hypothetical protein